MATSITEITGIGEHTARLLMENGFSSAQQIAEADENALTQVKGFGPARAKNIIAAAKLLVGESKKQKKKENVKELKKKSSKKTKKKEKSPKKEKTKKKKKDKDKTDSKSTKKKKKKGKAKKK